MSGFVNSVSIQQDVPTSQVNFSQGIQAVKINNLNADAYSVIYTTNGTDLKGDNNILKFEEDIKKLTVFENASYVSDYPIGIETAINADTFYTGIFCQNKNASNGSSCSILLTNDNGTDANYYGGLTMSSSTTTPAFNQFASLPNALSVNNQSASVVISAWNGQQDGTPEQNDNIFLCYNGATKAHYINHYGQLVVGANNAGYTGNTYGGDNGGTNKVLMSNGEDGLKWVDIATLKTLLNN